MGHTGLGTLGMVVVVVVVVVVGGGGRGGGGGGGYIHNFFSITNECFYCM